MSDYLIELEFRLSKNLTILKLSFVKISNNIKKNEELRKSKESGDRS